MIIGRLAPSPTGYLHLGNAWAFLWAWLACRQANGRLILRMEDIDPIRSTDEFAAEIQRDLRWLGLNWDGEIMIQSRRTIHYENALNRLNALGRVYPCYCTRKELRDMAGAPHVDDRGAPYPGICRHLTSEDRAAKEAAGRHPCIRLNTEDLKAFAFDDLVRGNQSMTLEECGGDFALRRSDGVWAYQLAVTVDDGMSGVNQVVRGEDILVSTPRQLALFDLLGFRAPVYAHIPLLCDEKGERLAKRHQSLSLRSLRASAHDPTEIIGKLAHAAGMISEPSLMTAQELIPLFDIAKLPNHDVLLDMSQW